MAIELPIETTYCLFDLVAFRPSFFWGRLFSRKKTPGGHAGGLAKWGGITKIGFTCPKSQNVVWKPTGLTNRFYMSKIPKCHLETYWANKEVFFVLWAHGPWGP